jgi:hypothetical protein
MSDAALDAVRDLIQQDPCGRGLRTDPAENLVTACPRDFHDACRCLADAASPAVAVVTGFWIPHGCPPAAETDGPLGAVFLARALVPLGFQVVLATDGFCARALEVGLGECGLRKRVPVVTLPAPEAAGRLSGADYWQAFSDRAGPLTHLIALERVGPSHTPQSLAAHPGGRPEHVERFVAEVPPEHHDRCHTMRGRDITTSMSPAHRLFEAAPLQQPAVTTVGVGDGGNEIGMGKLPWDVVRRNVPGGAVVACRVPADYLVVCGLSNWGAYGLGTGVRLLRGAAPDPDLFDPARERSLLEAMVEHGPLVDGVTGEATATVDGLPFEVYAEVLTRLGRLG